MRATKQKVALLTASSLAGIPVQPKNWIVDGLLRTGRRRPSLLAGKAGDGKSTLAKQLAVCVVQAKPFLGRATKRSPVILWQCEDEAPDVIESLLKMGYMPGIDEEIHILDVSPEENNVDTLRQAVIEHPDVPLIIVETIDDLIQCRDSNSGTDVREAFNRLHSAVGEFMPRIAVLGLHHLNKSEMATRAEGLSGSLQWKGKTDGTWFYGAVSEDDQRRTFLADVRSGKSFPKTYVEWNEETTTVSLGLSVYEENKKSGADKTEDRILMDIVQFFARNPNTILDKCKRSVSGHKPTIRKIILKAALDGILLPSGQGISGDPFLYAVNPNPPTIDNSQFEEQIGRAA